MPKYDALDPQCHQQLIPRSRSANSVPPQPKPKFEANTPDLQDKDDEAESTQEPKPASVIIRGTFAHNKSVNIMPQNFRHGTGHITLNQGSLPSMLSLVSASFIGSTLALLLMKRLES
ncbi:hypothetical protein F5Y00DRAFT_269232 [Daldinia vernicosa]|uniref:uncharacterized protein n=1 Tax=Daldinia vernicosa TaxID=114800 RepID=UPI0020081F96|nr:uncharacterized protein F5Y00DRAFT_269232 [Daldinia vernicosa]KAI0853859.1 hypothetical protein F5Y00DRAFT_269232 [Daldinia vernicosa]